MPTERSKRIAKIIRSYDQKAGREYLDHADVREGINDSAVGNPDGISARKIAEQGIW